MKRLFLKALALTLTGSLLASCGGNDTSDDQTPGSVLDVALRGSFSGLILAAQKSGLEAALLAPNANITLLAPDNAAFALLASQFGYRQIEDLFNNLPPATLEAIVRHHIVPVRLTAADITAGGASLNTSLTQGGVPVPLAVSTSAPEGIRLTDSVGRFAIVGVADVPADNGIIHTIDRVLIPPAVLTVLQTVQSDPDRFAPLIGAIRGIPDLDLVLNGAGPFTLFAPVEAAFEEPAVAALLPTLSELQRTALLQYHVVGANVPSSAISFGTPVNTLANQSFTIRAGTPPVLAVIDDTSATDANITAVDIRASNGVVHIIDKVLLPVLQ